MDVQKFCVGAIVVNFVHILSTNALINCHGLRQTIGMRLDCTQIENGYHRYNCSEPVPSGTVAYFGCKNYYKIESKNAISSRRIKCEYGVWKRYKNFQNFKCTYECGKASPMTKTYTHNGKLARRQIWPWHALLYLRENGTKKMTYICGGTLISSNLVLTAAHCLTNKTGQSRNPEDFIVVLGGVTKYLEKNARFDNTIFSTVDNIFIPDAFKYTEYKGDIAILEIHEKPPFNRAILPVCLPQVEDDSKLFLALGTYGEVVGSRLISGEHQYDELSVTFVSKKLQVLPPEECAANSLREPNDFEYCAGHKDATLCSGDSGGGMIFKPNFGLRRKYTIQGIVSHGLAGQLCTNYGSFTRVYKYMSWISKVMRENKLRLQTGVFT